MNRDNIRSIASDTEVTAILSLQSEECRRFFSIDYEVLSDYARTKNISMVNKPMLDFNDDHQRQVLPGAVRALHDLLAAGHRVYVHCTAGLNRSPLVVLGYLTFVDQDPLEAALAIIREARPQAEPSLAAYDGCRADLVDALRDHISVRAYYLSEELVDSPTDVHWGLAERDVLRGAFVNAKTFPCSRLDPNRGP